MSLRQIAKRRFMVLSGLTGAALLSAALVVPAFASQERSSGGRQPSGTAAAQQPAGNLPSAADVLKKYVEVTGGEEAYKKIKTQHLTGKISLPDMGLEGTFEQHAQQPDKSIVVMDFAGMGQITTGLNGKVAWQVDQMQGPRIIEGDQATSMMRDANTAATLKPEEFFKDMEVKGVEDADGEKAYKVVMVPKDSANAIESWYSVDSGLLLKSASTQSTPMGDVRIESRFEDYKDSAGEVKVKQPHKMTTSFSGTNFVMTVEKVETNVEIPESKFALPDEIKQLVEKASAKQPM